MAEFGDRNEDCDDTPSPKTPVAPPSNLNMNFMSFPRAPFSAPPPQPPPFPSFSPYDSNFAYMTQQPTSYMNMLTSHHTFHATPSPHNSNCQSGESHATKMVNEVGGEAISPSRKKKKVAAKRRLASTIIDKAPNTRGVHNMYWTARHDDVLIPVLAQLARDGLKVDKNFKMHAYKVAADEVNKQCGTEFTKENVMNHMKSLKSKFFDMRTVMNMSGAGFDPASKIVTMDPDSFDMWTNDNKCNSSKLKEYLNTPLMHYDDLCTIVGDDQARGNYAKDVSKKLGNNRPNPLFEDPINLCEDDDIETSKSQFGAKTPSVERLDPHSQKVKSANGVTSTSNAKPHSKNKGGKGREDDSLMRELIEYMSHSIQNQHILHWTDRMSKALHEHAADFSETILDKVLDFLYDNETESRRFIIKSKNAQKLFLEKIIRENGFAPDDLP